MSKPLDLVGRVFGKLTVLEFDSRTKGSGSKWKCKCICGDIVYGRARSLLCGDKKTCGKKRCRTENLIGKIFGFWKVIDYDTDRSDGSRHSFWICKCKCGKELSIRGSSLIEGNSKSCRCFAVETSKKINSLPEGESSFNGLYRRYQREAKSRSLEWTIEREEFKILIYQNCEYCGQEPSNIQQRISLNGPIFYNGIDRINNKMGYVKGNIVPCCKVCNRLKYKDALESFLAYIERIHNFQLKKNGISLIIEKQLLEALQTTIKAQADLIALLKSEIDRLKTTSQVGTTNPFDYTTPVNQPFIPVYVPPPSITNPPISPNLPYATLGDYVDDPSKHLNDASLG